MSKKIRNKKEIRESILEEQEKLNLPLQSNVIQAIIFYAANKGRNNIIADGSLLLFRIREAVIRHFGESEALARTRIGYYDSSPSDKNKRAIAKIAKEALSNMNGKCPRDLKEPLTALLGLGEGRTNYKNSWFFIFWEEIKNKEKKTFFLPDNFLREARGSIDILPSEIKDICFGIGEKAKDFIEKDVLLLLNKEIKD